MLASATSFGEPCVVVGGVIVGSVILNVSVACDCCSIATRFSLRPSSLKDAKTRCWNLLLSLTILSHLLWFTRRREAAFNMYKLVFVCVNVNTYIYNM